MRRVTSKTVVCDTTVWIDYFGGKETLQTVWLERHLSTTRIALTDLILCEVLQGIREDKQFKAIRKDLLRFTFVENGGKVISTASARHYRDLRRKGITIRKMVDCFIATLCIEHGFELLHNDRDFDPFEDHLGLRVVHADRVT